MYMAPLNYDKYFKKVFSNERIAKCFLEDFLEVSITSLKRLPKQHRVTDDAAIVEFDFRCKIKDAYVVIDMQQWYKPDLVQRFYLYHSLNAGLQFEHLPKKWFIADKPAMKLRKAGDCRGQEPVLSLIWLADDMLRFTENYVAYTMAPELMINFVTCEHLWYNPEIRKLLAKQLLAERKRVLKIARNKAKALPFLSRNRLVFMLQKNIVKQAGGDQYERWFRFAEKSRNPKNKKADFKEFQKDKIFEEMMRRLNKGKLTKEDMEYIASEQEMWEETARLEKGYYQEGRKEGREEGREEGQLAEKHEVAGKMLAKGYSPNEAAEIAGLPLEKIAGDSQQKKL